MNSTLRCSAETPRLSAQKNQTIKNNNEEWKAERVSWLRRLLWKNSSFISNDNKNINSLSFILRNINFPRTLLVKYIFSSSFFTIHKNIKEYQEKNADTKLKPQAKMFKYSTKISLLLLIIFYKKYLFKELNYRAK